jgi:putative chitinase
MITIKMMKRLWPNGDAKIPGLVEGIVASAPVVFSKYGAASSMVVAHAMAQFSHECGAGGEMVENINYTAERAHEIWPGRFPSAGEVYAKVGSFPGDPDFHIKLIDSVYGNRMGNRPGTHDGSAFIGRGLSQVTGREGYENLSAKTGLDLINHPELASDPANALECGVADFVLCGCLPFAVQDNIYEVTKHLNGGEIGLAERTAWLAKWKAALVQNGLNVLGASPTLVVDGDLGPGTQTMIRAFQAKNGLATSGEIDAALCAAIDSRLAAMKTGA